MFGKVQDALTNVLAELCGWFLLIVMSLILVDLVSRAMGTPIYGVSESAMFVMIAIVYMGLPYTEKMQAHVRVELILDALPPRVAAIVDLVMYILVAFTMFVVLYAVTVNASVSYEGRQAIAGPTPLLVWPVKFVMVAALVLYVLRILANLWIILRNVIAQDTRAAGDI
jgi:TRAP-type C4-dicarboxylate transport system permease small subunit